MALLANMEYPQGGTMKYICGQFADGYTITYRIPNELAQEVLNWLTKLGPVVKAWVREDQ